VATGEWLPSSSNFRPSMEISALSFTLCHNSFFNPNLVQNLTLDFFSRVGATSKYLPCWINAKNLLIFFGS